MRDTKAFINIKNLKHNVARLRELIPGTNIIAVVKANAYGHDSIAVTRALREIDVEFAGVAFAEEGRELRKAGDKGKLLLISPGRRDEIDMLLENDMRAAVADMRNLKHWSETASKKGKVLPVHLFINTGMNRDGIEPETAVDFMNEARNLPGIEFEGLMSHFATAEFEDRDFALKQLALFEKTRDELLKSGYDFKYTHVANSGASVNIAEARIGTIRPGLALYGLLPDERLLETLPLRPVMELKSAVTANYRVKPGQTAGYAFKYVNRRQCDTEVAVVPIGYGDGFLRCLGNKADCLIAGKRFPISGSVCMDQILVDTGTFRPEIGAEAVLIGKQGNEEITAYELAKLAGTIPYEITAEISKRVPRVIVQ